MYFKARLLVKSLLWPRPKLYWTIGTLQGQPWLFSKKYDILIDGFQRSANSFAAEAVRLTQPNLRVLSHRHMPVYVIQALAYQKPVCVTIRDPIDAVASWVLFSKIPIPFALDDYIIYYDIISAQKDKLVVAEFKAVTDTFPDILVRLNNKYRLGLKIPDWNDGLKSSVLERVRKYPWASDPLKASVPTAEREATAIQIKTTIQSGEYDAKLTRAYELYKAFSRTNTIE